MRVGSTPAFVKFAIGAVQIAVQIASLLFRQATVARAAIRLLRRIAKIALRLPLKAILLMALHLRMNKAMAPVIGRRRRRHRRRHRRHHHHHKQVSHASSLTTQNGAARRHRYDHYRDASRWHARAQTRRPASVPATRSLQEHFAYRLLSRQPPHSSETRTTSVLTKGNLAR